MVIFSSQTEFLIGREAKFRDLKVSVVRPVRMMGDGAIPMNQVAADAKLRILTKL